MLSSIINSLMTKTVRRVLILFLAATYLAANEDVQAAVTAGALNRFGALHRVRLLKPRSDSGITIPPLKLPGSRPYACP